MMLFKTEGVVLGFMKFRESSIITSIYTEQLGLQRYVVNGVRSKKSRINIALFQPLTLLNLVVYHKPDKDLHRISEIRCSHPFQRIPFEIKLITIALFISEVLIKSLKEDLKNPDLFRFLKKSIMVLDSKGEGQENFHLQFLLKFPKYLGFQAESSEILIQELHDQGRNHNISIQELDILNKLAIKGYQDSPQDVNNQMRRKFLKMLIEFYTLHNESFARINSPRILMEISG